MPLLCEESLRKMMQTLMENYGRPQIDYYPPTVSFEEAIRDVPKFWDGVERKTFDTYRPPPCWEDPVKENPKPVPSPENDDSEKRQEWYDREEENEQE